jgi:hypothetical protein
VRELVGRDGVWLITWGKYALGCLMVGLVPDSHYPQCGGPLGLTQRWAMYRCNYSDTV